MEEGLTPVQQWITEDEQLSRALVEIEKTGLSIDGQAELAFHKISDMYGLPKNPDDVVENVSEDYDGEQPSSVYEELGYAKYLNPADDLRGLVLAAIYAVKNGLNIDDSEIDKTSISGIGFRGENSEVELILVKEGESWVDLGCKLFKKEVDIEGSQF